MLNYFNASWLSNTGDLPVIRVESVNGKQVLQLLDNPPSNLVTLDGYARTMNKKNNISSTMHMVLWSKRGMNGENKTGQTNK